MSIMTGHIEFDQPHEKLKNEAKSLVHQLERLLDKTHPGRTNSLARTTLEECYMWIGKSIRDDQMGIAGEDDFGRQ